MFEFSVNKLTDRQTDRQTDAGQNITSPTCDSGNIGTHSTNANANFPLDFVIMHCSEFTKRHF